MTIRSMLQQTLAIVFSITIVALSQQALALEEGIGKLSAQATVEMHKAQVLNISIYVDQQRDLHLNLKDLKNNKIVKRIIRKVSEPGDYEIPYDLEGFAAGEYQVIGFLTPVNKSWKEKVSDFHSHKFSLAAASANKDKTNYRDDKLKLVLFKPRVESDKENNLLVRYDISQPRDLHIRLLDTRNWTELDSWIHKLSDSGQQQFQFSELADSYPSGKYAFVVYLSETGDYEPIVKKWGRKFKINNSASMAGL